MYKALTLIQFLLKQLELKNNKPITLNVIWNVFFCLFIFPITLNSQTAKINTSNPDSLYFVANSYSQNGNYELCREICFSVLNDYPNYLDFNLLAGRTLAWENQFDSAKILIEPIILDNPYQKDALLLLADIEIWQINYQAALAYVDTGLVQLPQDTLLLYKRAEIIKKMEAKPPISPISYGTMSIDSNAIGISYYFDFFKKPYIARRHMVSLQYTKITRFAPISGRLNIGNNIFNGKQVFDSPSYQAEIDAYPRLGEKSYLYLNYGIGTGDFFPTHKGGLEYFKGLNKGFGLSIGGRYMYWDNSIYFLTGSISKYFGDYWLSFRPFFTIKEDILSNAYLFENRKYFGRYNSYLFGLVVFGDSPDQPLMSAQKFGNFKSTKFVAGIQHRIQQFQFNASAGIQYEEFQVNNSRTRTEYRIGVSYVF